MDMTHICYLTLHCRLTKLELQHRDDHLKARTCIFNYICNEILTFKNKFAFPFVTLCYLSPFNFHYERCFYLIYHYVERNVIKLRNLDW